MEHTTPQALLSPREDTLVFLRAFARAYRPLAETADGIILNGWDMTEERQLN